jgi:5-methylcytosine-specific restriction protein A
MAKNPVWTRDELILALELYLRRHPNTISQAHPDVVELSETLNSLPIHASSGANPTFSIGARL